MAVDTRRKVVGLVGWLAIVFVAAGAGAVASVHAGTFYTGLVRPSWAPPPSVFGPVWTVLYALMGIAAWLVWSDGGFRERRGALTVFLAQLVANALWSWIFFSWHLGALAFADIVLLWVLIIVTIVAFWRVSRAAGAMLLPNVVWVSFAAALNFSVWQLNPQALGS